MLTRHREPFHHTLLSLLLIGDALFCFAGLSLGYWVRFETPLRAIGIEPGDAATYRNYLPLLALGTGFFILGCAHLKLYDARFLLRPNHARAIILRSVFFWFAAFLSTSLVLKFAPPISRLFVAFSCITTIATVLAWRTAFHLWLSHSRHRRNLTQRVVLVGWTDAAAEITNAILRDQNHPYEIIGTVETAASTPARRASSYPRLGDIDQLDEILQSHNADMVIVADLNLPRDQLLSVAEQTERNYAAFKVIPSFFQIFVSNLRLQTISGVPILGVEELPIRTLTNRYLKRLLDLGGALVGLVVTAPIVAVLAYLIKRESPGGPVFFGQLRVGYGHRPFTLYKLRSMRPGADEHDSQHQSTPPGDWRLLRIGSFMRHWNLDELPQFWNVLKGDMSLVGPRPERPFHVDQLAKEIPHYLPRHLVQPGMTGWAQVNGLRGNTSLAERIKYDLFYIENWSLWFDLQILVKTLFGRSNAYGALPPRPPAPSSASPFSTAINPESAVSSSNR